MGDPGPHPICSSFGIRKSASQTACQSVHRFLQVWLRLIYRLYNNRQLWIPAAMRLKTAGGETEGESASAAGGRALIACISGRRSTPARSQTYKQKSIATPRRDTTRARTPQIQETERLLLQMMRPAGRATLKTFQRPRVIAGHAPKPCRSGRSAASR